MKIENLLESKTEKIINFLPINKKASEDANKNYLNSISLNEKYKHISPNYKKYKPKPIYLRT